MLQQIGLRLCIWLRQQLLLLEFAGGPAEDRWQELISSSRGRGWWCLCYLCVRRSSLTPQAKLGGSGSLQRPQPIKPAHSCIPSFQIWKVLGLVKGKDLAHYRLELRALFYEPSNLHSIAKEKRNSQLFLSGQTSNVRLQNTLTCL